MKKIFFVITILFLGYFGVLAQTQTPVATKRQVNQRVRIAHGAANGELTKTEARALKMEQRHINRVKKRAKADGVVTNEEKHRINRKQRRASRHIGRQKHDEQSRN